MKTDEMIALGALIVAVCSFFLTIYQARLSRKHNQLQVKPYLDLTCVSTLNEGFKCILKNYGTGPAYIEKINYYLDGEKYEVLSPDDFKALLLEVGLENISLDIRHCHFHKHSALSSSEQVNLFELTNSANKPYNHIDIITCLKRISITVDYECSYGLKFISERSGF
ncbi:TPA: hypothetical protein I6199_003019 [Vibrio cholerae]|nr:hypothetical protein [Vibrio cholerae]HDI3237645.1 hypothetical protein [Vibrio cholerae]